MPQSHVENFASLRNVFNDRKARAKHSCVNSSARSCSPTMPYKNLKMNRWCCSNSSRNASSSPLRALAISSSELSIRVLAYAPRLYNWTTFSLLHQQADISTICGKKVSVTRVFFRRTLRCLGKMTGSHRANRRTLRRTKQVEKGAVAARVQRFIVVGHLHRHIAWIGSRSSWAATIKVIHVRHDQPPPAFILAQCERELAFIRCSSFRTEATDNVPDLSVHCVRERPK